MSVSEQLHTYPSPNLTTVNQYHIRVNVGLGEGQVYSCSDTDVNPNNSYKYKIKTSFAPYCWCHPQQSHNRAKEKTPEPS